MPDFSLEQELHARGFPLWQAWTRWDAARWPVPWSPPRLFSPQPWTARTLDVPSGRQQKLSPRQRAYALELVETHALAIGVAQIAPGVIDRMGIGRLASTQCSRPSHASLWTLPTCYWTTFRFGNADSPFRQSSAAMGLACQ